MGCCESQGTFSKNSFSSMVKDSIDKNNAGALKKIIISPMLNENTEEAISNLDRPILKVNQIELNALAYCLYLNRTGLFTLLHKLGCDVQKMEKLLLDQGISPMHFICVRGFSDLLSYYLSYYDIKSTAQSFSNSSFYSEFFSNFESEYTPVQLATQLGHVGIIDVVHTYFAESAPFELNLNQPNGKTGENCPLIACRFGNYSMVRYLHKKCNGDFLLKNKHGQSAIQIAVENAKIKPHLKYLDIIVYLVEIIGVNLRYNYEEILLLAEDEEIVKYVEARLEKFGISAKKAEIIKESEKKTEKPPETCMDSLNIPQFNYLNLYSIQVDKESSASSFHKSDQSFNSIFGSNLSEFHK